MDEARAVLDRLAKIERLDRGGAGPTELLPELRALLAEAESWARVEGGDAKAAVERFRRALAPDMIRA
jgi:hypothetical protein